MLVGLPLFAANGDDYYDDNNNANDRRLGLTVAEQPFATNTT